MILTEFCTSVRSNEEALRLENIVIEDIDPAKQDISNQHEEKNHGDGLRQADKNLILNEFRDIHSTDQRGRKAKVQEGNHKKDHQHHRQVLRKEHTKCLLQSISEGYSDGGLMILGGLVQDIDDGPNIDHGIKGHEDQQNHNA